MVEGNGYPLSGITQEAIPVDPELRAYCFAFSAYPIGDAKSNITWATNYTLPPPNGTQIDTQNAYSWKAARSYYRGALTAASAVDRQRYYAETFRALGQVLHMLQDMGVPSHVRSDFLAHFETNFSWLSLDKWKWQYEPYELQAAKENNKLMSDYGSAEKIIRPSFEGGISLTKFWDTNRYSSTCRNGTRKSGRDLGLAEYTNANFLSGNTVFTEGLPCDDNYQFPHPALNETDFDQNVAPVMVVGKDGKLEMVRYIHVTDTEGLESWEASKRIISKISWSDYYTYGSGKNATVDLDDNLFTAMASRLIPRAIGYSAALLDCFFRGKFDDPGDGRPFVELLENRHIRVNIKNGSGERMSGTLMLYQDSGGEEVHGENPLLPVLKTALVTLEPDESYNGPEFQDVPVTVPPGKQSAAVSRR